MFSVNEYFYTDPTCNDIYYALNTDLWYHVMDDNTGHRYAVVIAEGSGKSSSKDFSRYLEIAISSAFELETLCMLAADLDFIDNDKSDPILTKIQEIQKMIYSFKNTITDRTNKL